MKCEKELFYNIGEPLSLLKLCHRQQQRTQQKRRQGQQRQQQQRQRHKDNDNEDNDNENYRDSYNQLTSTSSHCLAAFMLVGELVGGAITLSNLALMLSLVEELGMLGGAIELSTLITIFSCYASSSKLYPYQSLGGSEFQC